MRLLVDAHSLIWAVDNPTKLTAAATAALEEPSIIETLSIGCWPHKR